MPAFQPLPTIEKLNALFEEKEPGLLYYRGRGSTKVPFGGIAGNISGGYCTINIGGYKYLRHRLIWKMHKGVDPLGVIDHIDEIPGNDWIDNLQDVTMSHNARNGRHYVQLKLNNTQDGLVNALAFNFDLWADENGEELRQQLDNLVTPIIEAVLTNRMGRKRIR